jgi:putative heme iron utilization protein
MAREVHLHLTKLLVHPGSLRVSAIPRERKGTRADGIILVTRWKPMSASKSASEPVSEPAAPRQHANTGPAAPALAEPTHAERARTLFALASIATLSTQSRKHAGFPFGSLMPFALDQSGRPLFLISNMAMHTQNLKADGRASLFVTNAAPGDDPLGAARITLVGNALPVPSADLSDAREKYLARHPGSSYWVDFSDFSFFRLNPVELYYVGGFGVMGWVTADDYTSAESDPLAEAAPGILAHMNADHGPAMIVLARTHSAIEATEAAMTSVDRLGFTLRLTSSEGSKGTRINFPEPVRDAEQTRAALVAMLRAAKA